MSEMREELTVAAIQAAPVFLDRDRTVEKACDLISEAGTEGADVVVFPEGFIPGHPLWYHFHGVSTDLSRELSTMLFENAVAVPGSVTERLGDAAVEAGTLVVVGICEREKSAVGTMYNSQIFLSADGELLGKHQKLTPTLGERLVHTRGKAEHFGAIETPYGSMSSMICSENANPLAAYELLSQYPRLHAMSWPSYFEGMTETINDISRLYAQMSKAHVVSAASVVSDRALDLMELSDEQAKKVRANANTGGSVVLGPGREVLAGPLGTDEKILYANINLRDMVPHKLAQDYAGHYNRPDIFEFKRRQGNQLSTGDRRAYPTGESNSDSDSAKDTVDKGSSGTDTVTGTGESSAE